MNISHSAPWLNTEGTFRWSKGLFRVHPSPFFSVTWWIFWAQSMVHSAKGWCLCSELIMGVFWAELKSNQSECRLPVPLRTMLVCGMHLHWRTGMCLTHCCAILQSSVPSTLSAYKKNTLISHWGGGALEERPSLCTPTSVHGSGRTGHEKYHPDQWWVGWEGRNTSSMRKILMTSPAEILQQQKQYVHLYINMHIHAGGRADKLHWLLNTLACFLWRVYN